MNSERDVALPSSKNNRSQQSLYTYLNLCIPMADLEERCENEFRICPENHAVPYTRWNYAEDFSDGSVDADGLPMYENGMWCLSCDRAYGISKLIDPKNSDSRPASQGD